MAIRNFGLFYSNDNGASFTRASDLEVPAAPGSTTIVRPVVNTIAEDPSDASRVLVGLTSHGVWESTDGGVNWDSILVDYGGSPTGWAVSVRSLAIDPLDGDHITAGTVAQLIRRTVDGGAVWTAAVTPYGGASTCPARPLRRPPRPASRPTPSFSVSRLGLSRRGDLLALAPTADGLLETGVLGLGDQVYRGLDRAWRYDRLARTLDDMTDRSLRLQSNRTGGGIERFGRRHRAVTDCPRPSRRLLRVIDGAGNVTFFDLATSTTGSRTSPSVTPSTTATCRWSPTPSPWPPPWYFRPASPMIRRPRGRAIGSRSR